MIKKSKTHRPDRDEADVSDREATGSVRNHKLVMILKRHHHDVETWVLDGKVLISLVVWNKNSLAKAVQGARSPLNFFRQSPTLISDYIMQHLEHENLF